MPVKVSYQPGRRMPRSHQTALGQYEVEGTPDPNEELSFPPTNPAFGEVGWMSARPLSDPVWSQWYDKYMAGGGGNPMSKSAFKALANASPTGSNQLTGTSVQPNNFTAGKQQITALPKGYQSHEEFMETYNKQHPAQMTSQNLQTALQQLKDVGYQTHEEFKDMLKKKGYYS